MGYFDDNLHRLIKILFKVEVVPCDVTAFDSSGFDLVPSYPELALCASSGHMMNHLLNFKCKQSAAINPATNTLFLTSIAQQMFVIRMAYPFFEIT